MKFGTARVTPGLGAVLPRGKLSHRSKTGRPQGRSLEGSCEFAAFVYDQRLGKIIVSTYPQWGFSRKDDWTVLFSFAWSKDGLGIPGDKPAGH